MTDETRVKVTVEQIVTYTVEIERRPHQTDSSIGREAIEQAEEDKDYYWTDSSWRVVKIEKA